MDVLSAGASLIGAGLQYAGAEDANAQSAANAGVQRDWEQAMSNTAYTRQVADLKAAGLNPMLGYLRSSGASTPTYSPPQVQNPWAHASTSAGEAFRNYSEDRKRQQEEKNLETERRIKDPVAKVADSAGSTIEEVKAIIPSVAAAVSDAVLKVEDKTRANVASAASDPDPAVALAAHAVRGREGTPLASSQKLVQRLTTSAADSVRHDRVDAPSPSAFDKLHFKGNYDTVMAEIKRIRNPADRKAATAQYMKQITR